MARPKQMNIPPGVNACADSFNLLHSIETGNVDKTARLLNSLTSEQSTEVILIVLAWFARTLNSLDETSHKELWRSFKNDVLADSLN
jgi:hypothetical protein